MDQVFLRDLSTRGCIGIGEKERSRPQELLVNIVFYTDTRNGAQSDSINDCVDYSDAAKDILRLVEDNTRFTVEALAEDLASFCLRHALVYAVDVRVEKTSAIRFAKGAGVAIHREKEKE